MVAGCGYCWVEFLGDVMTGYAVFYCLTCKLPFTCGFLLVAEGAFAIDAM